MGKLITDAELRAKYGKPGDTSMLTIMPLPFPMIVAWDKKEVIHQIQVHRFCVIDLQRIFADILTHYGQQGVKDLGINLYGGCYNYRPMRGSETTWSRHAWGVAIDLDPDRNLLKETKKTARFARPEYKAMIDAFYAHNWQSLGVEKNYDWMHFQVAR